MHVYTCMHNKSLLIIDILYMHVQIDIIGFLVRITISIYTRDVRI